MSTENQPEPRRGLENELTPGERVTPRHREPIFWAAEKWLDLYLKEGLRIIPLYGAHDSNVFNAKKPGYPQWQKYIPAQEELLSAMDKGKMWGCVCGSVSGNLQIVDYDLYKILGSKDKALEWRRENIPLLQSLATLVTFTPSGGFHVWLRTREPGLQTSSISQITKSIPLEMDLVRGDGGQVVVPPSKLKDVGYYWFMDDSRIRRKRKLGIRVI